MELFRNFFALIGTGWTVLSKGFDIGHLLIFLIVCVLPVAFFTVQLVVCLKCKKHFAEIYSVLYNRIFGSVCHNQCAFL